MIIWHQNFNEFLKMIKGIFKFYKNLIKGGGMLSIQVEYDYSFMFYWTTVLEKSLWFLNFSLTSFVN